MDFSTIVQTVLILHLHWFSQPGYGMRETENTAPNTIHTRLPLTSEQGNSTPLSTLNPTERYRRASSKLTNDTVSKRLDKPPHCRLVLHE